jgi:hypothetical protein
MSRSDSKPAFFYCSLPKYKSWVLTQCVPHKIWELRVRKIGTLWIMSI